MSFFPVIRSGRGGITDGQLTAKYGPGAVLSVNVEVSALAGGTQDPYFSVTGEVTTAANHRQRDIEAGGCLHDEALAYYPECAPILAMHLSSAKTGAPMHAEANGWWWLSGAMQLDVFRPQQSPEECADYLKSHCRIDGAELAAVVERVRSVERGPCAECSTTGLRCDSLPCAGCRGSGVEADHLAYRRAWHDECEAMRPRWWRECLAGLAWMLRNASPPDLVAEWQKRVPMYTGHDLASILKNAPGETMPRTAWDGVS